jgi:hypothetical protein
MCGKLIDQVPTVPTWTTGGSLRDGGLVLTLFRLCSVRIRKTMKVIIGDQWQSARLLGGFRTYLLVGAIHGRQHPNVRMVQQQSTATAPLHADPTWPEYALDLAC